MYGPSLASQASVELMPAIVDKRVGFKRSISRNELGRWACDMLFKQIPLGMKAPPPRLLNGCNKTLGLPYEMYQTIYKMTIAMPARPRNALPTEPREQRLPGALVKDCDCRRRAYRLFMRASSCRHRPPACRRARRSTIIGARQRAGRRIYVWRQVK